MFSTWLWIEAENQLYFTSSSKSIQKTTNVPGEDHITPFCWPLSIQDAGWSDKADIHRLNQVVRQTSCPILLTNFPICSFAHLEFSLPAFIYRNVLVSFLSGMRWHHNSLDDDVPPADLDPEYWSNRLGSCSTLDLCATQKETVLFYWLKPCLAPTPPDVTHLLHDDHCPAHPSQSLFRVASRNRQSGGSIHCLSREGRLQSYEKALMALSFFDRPKYPSKFPQKPSILYFDTAIQCRPYQEAQDPTVPSSPLFQSPRTIIQQNALLLSPTRARAGTSIRGTRPQAWWSPGLAPPGPITHTHKLHPSNQLNLPNFPVLRLRPAIPWRQSPSQVPRWQQRGTRSQYHPGQREGHECRGCRAGGRPRTGAGAS